MASSTLVFEQDATLEGIKEKLQQEQSVTKLVLRHCNAVSSSDLQVLLEHINPDLDVLSVHNCQSFDDDFADRISEHCSKLTSISFTGNCGMLSATGISLFVKNCKSLKHVTIMSTDCDDLAVDEDDNKDDNDNNKSWLLNDDIFALFLERTDLQLEHFALCGFEDITSNGLKQFLAHVSSNLKSLDVSELSAVNDNTVEGLNDVCSSLTDVSFSHCKLTDEGVQIVCSKCKMLQSINLSGCQDISDDSVVALSSNCSFLKRVELGWCINLTEKSLWALVKNCSNLTYVDLSQCAIKHLPFEILDHPSLQELKLNGCTSLRLPPLQTVTKGLESCREFLKKCNLQSLCRMTFLGNQGSGKTSLMSSLPTMVQSIADTSTEGVHVSSWKPFKSGKESIDLGTDVNEKMLSLTVEMWDCGGRACLQGVHPLFLSEHSLYVIVFNVHDPFKIESVLRWMLLMRSKAMVTTKQRLNEEDDIQAPTSPFVVVGTHADNADDWSPLGNEVLGALKKADSNQRQEIQTEINMLRGLRQDKCIELRINTLENLVKHWSSLPQQVHFVSTLKGKGMTELQHTVTQTLMDSTLFPHLTEDISQAIIYLHCEILLLRENNTMLLSWDQYVGLASDAGITDDAVMKATAVLECKGCIVVFNIPTSYQNQGPSRTVCVNPSALLNCIAGVLCETDPREYVPQFVKAGKVERFWPTGAKPNEWTLRAAIDDIVSKGFVRESVVPLCFQIPTLLDEAELQNVISLFRSLGFLVEGAPKGNYDVELVMSQYKTCSVFKRYYLPLMPKLPTDPKDETVWPSSLPEGHIQVGWRYNFHDHVTVDSIAPLLIGACANLKPSCEILSYWNSGAILKVGPVTVKISRDNTTLDVIGRCKITDGSKQALIMTWIVLAKYFHVNETLLMNYKGMCPEITVPIVGCNRPKHKPLHELVSEYNSQVKHHTNYCWFIPPAALDTDEHIEIPEDTISWLAGIACKSMLYVSYHPDQQHEVKLLKQFLDLAGFDCLGDWALAGKTGPELIETRRKQIAGSSLFLAFVTPQYLDWTRATQDVNTALSHNKPLVSVLFDKSTWEQEGHELGSLLKDHGVCLDLSAGSGSALSHQYDQGQVSRLITYCNGTLYGTGDIHPPEPPRTPEHEAQVNNANLDSSCSVEVETDAVPSKRKTSVEVDRKPSKTASDKITEDEKVAEQIRRMAASAVAAAVAGATAQQISKSKHSTPAIKAAAAAADVAQAVANGNSDGAAQAVSKVAKIVEDERLRLNSIASHNGSATRPPPKSATCILL